LIAFALPPSQSPVGSGKQIGRFAASLLAEDPDLIWDGDLQVQVSNEAGFILFTVITVGIKSPVVG
jgi:hypothetical protein